LRGGGKRDVVDHRAQEKEKEPGVLEGKTQKRREGGSRPLRLRFFIRVCGTGGKKKEKRTVRDPHQREKGRGGEKGGGKDRVSSRSLTANTKKRKKNRRERTSGGGEGEKKKRERKLSQSLSLPEERKGKKEKKGEHLEQSCYGSLPRQEGDQRKKKGEEETIEISLSWP